MDKIAAFDTLSTNNHIQMCKILLPSLPKDKQYLFAVLIKFWELSYVIKCGQKLLCSPDCNSPGSPDYQSVCKELLPYCDQKEAASLQTMLQLLGMMDTIKTIAPLLDLMKQMQSESGEGSNSTFMPDLSSLFSMGNLTGNPQGDSPENFPGNIFGGSVSPELFDMLGSFFHAADYSKGEPQKETPDLQAEESDIDVSDRTNDTSK